MSNDYFVASNAPATGSALSSSTQRAEFAAIEDGFDKLPTLTANANEVVTVNSGATGMTSTPAATLLAATTTAATTKATPVDADELPIADSAASYVLKKLTWANLKATIKAWIEATSFAKTATQTIAVNSASAALTVTQTGAGNAFVVEDETSPDSTPFVVTASGQVGIGVVPTSKLSIYDATSATITLQGDSTTNLTISRYSTDATQATFNLRKGRGTVSAPTAVATNDTVGLMQFVAYAGTNNRNVATITGAVEAYVSDTDIAGRLTFSTTPVGSFSSSERMRINSAGSVLVGTTSAATGSPQLDVVGASGICVSSVDTDATNKNGRYAARHYTNAEEPILAVNLASQAADNFLSIGGGSASFNAATQVRVFTGATNTTVTGTEKMLITSDGTTTLGGTSTAPALSVIPVGSQTRWVTVTGSAGGNPTIGTNNGAINLNPGGNGVSLQVATAGASTVNYAEHAGATAGNSPYIAWTGSDTNVSGIYYTKGTGGHIFSTASGSTQVQINHTASANRYITLTGSNGGNPTIGTSAGELNISSTSVTVGTSLANKLGLFGNTGGSAVGVIASGTDTNIGININTKGTGSIGLNTGGGTQAIVSDTTSANRYIILTGSNGGTPTINTSAGSLALNSATSADYFALAGGTGIVAFAAAGSSSNINIWNYSKGTGGHVWLTGTPSATQFVILDRAGANRAINVTGGVAASNTYPTISATGTSAGTIAITGGAIRGIATNTGATLTIDETHYQIIQTTIASVYTLPSAANYSGRILKIVTQFAGTVTSASSNVVPLAGGAAGTAILAATAGRWATIQSNGTNWVIVAAN